MTTPKARICQSISAGLPTFTTAPEKGHIHVSREHIYECLGESDGMANARGSISWKTHCAECGEAFIVYSNLKSRGLSRRCEKHKQAGVRVPREGIHPAAQVWPAPTEETSRRQKVVLRGFKRELSPAEPKLAAPAATAHPLYAKWCEYVNAHPEAKRSTLLSFKAWLEHRENALD